MTKTIYFLLIAVLFAFSANAQPGPVTQNEVGVNEQLGKFIPMDLKFARETGDSVTLGKIVNKPTIFLFVYFDCTELCIPLMQGVSEVIRRSDLHLGKDYQVVTISLDPRDTPAKATQSKASFTKGMTPEETAGWTFLTTDSATVFKMIHSVGYNIKAVGMEFIHPAAIVVVSPKGMVTRYLYGLTFLPFDVKMAIAEASKGIARPTIQKLLLLCYTYDPAGKRYALEVTKLAGVMILFFLLLLVVVLYFKRKKEA